jgi:metallo-beta-lactamase class B
MAADYAMTFRRLKDLPCDVFLGAHGSYFDMKAKLARMKAGGPNPFIDADGYRKYVAEAQQDYLKELARQTAAKR